MDRISTIRKSLFVFVLGIVGLFPVIGLVAAIYALMGCRQIRAQYHDPWNPAARYLKAGCTMARIGFFVSLTLVVLVLLVVAFNLMP